MTDKVKFAFELSPVDAENVFSILRDAQTAAMSEAQSYRLANDMTPSKAHHANADWCEGRSAYLANLIDIIGKGIVRT